MKSAIICGLWGILLITSCTSPEDEEEVYDLEEIVEIDTLTAVTSYSPTSYFLYRGEPMGYNYQMLSRFVDHLNVELELKLSRSLSEMFDMLHSGEVDLIAHNLTVTGRRAQQVAFTRPLNTTRQVLVQRKPQNWRNMCLHEIERELLRSPIDLNGKDVHVRENSAFMSRLENLSDEIGGEINIIEADEDVMTEDLIAKVAEGEIDYTVADKNIARINEAYFPNLDSKTEISLPQNLSWAVHPRSVSLLTELNDWLEGFQRQTDYYVIYNKYYENRTAYRNRFRSDLLSVHSGRISQYDEMIKRHANEVNWDWRLLAALIFQESRFNPNARSGAGAVGLMQLMPRTARSFGASNPRDPQQNVRAGVRFIGWLKNYWENHIEDEEERMKFILASYNTGQGHVQDARRLAEVFGDVDPDVWTDNVERYMLKKANREYFNHEVVRHGFSRGSEPVNYVNRIFYMYEHYELITNFHDLIDPEDELALMD